MENENHKKIIEILRDKGPSLPMVIAKNLNMNSLFTSAFLSELSNEKKIKASHLKIGGSKLYFLEGQEEKLEEFHKYLHPKEIEAFLLIKKNKLIKDSEQEPAIRVALRSIRDFAIGFKKYDEIYWKYSFISDEEIEKLLNPKPIKKTPSQKQTKKNTKEYTKKQLVVSEPEFQNPLIIKEKEKEKGKEKSNFVLKVIDFIKENNLELIEEKNHKAKEYTCIIRIKSQLGKISFLTQAKDKKIISETDLKKLLSESQKIPLPAFLIYTGKIGKKAKDYLAKYPSILKTTKIA